MRATDRCDRCGAQAYVLWCKGPGELLMCAHHANEHELTLVTSGWELAIDDRANVLPPPDSVMEPA